MRRLMTGTIEQTSRLHLPSAAAASVIAGAVAGAITTAFFAMATADQFTTGLLLDVLGGAFVGSVVGVAIALLPGIAISLLLQKFALTHLAPLVGAIVGAVSPVVVFGWTSENGLGAVDLVGFGLSGAIGGAFGGVALHRGRND